MHMIINHSSMVPIYEQIMNQIKAAITSGELKADTGLPSVRNLARELKISALTVKKAYDYLEEEGFTVTVHGKGTFVASGNRERIREEQRRCFEEELGQVLEKGRQAGIPEEEIREIFEMMMEE